MVIKPLVPVTPPELDAVAPPRTLPFRNGSEFMQMLKAASAATHDTPQPVSHKVQSGESLWKICADALAANGTAPSNTEINEAVHRAAAANRLKDPNVLSVGQQLDLSAIRSSAPSPISLNTPPPLVPNPAPLAPGPAGSVAAVSQTGPAPLAARSSAPNGPSGGGISSVHPLYHRFAIARPQIEIDPDRAAAVQSSIAPPMPVDLTALMQTILEPSSQPADAAVDSSPWSKLLAGPARFTSGYGLRSDPYTGKPEFHDGVDIAAAPGTDILPYMPGTVKSVGWDPGHGNMVVIEHPNGMETVYAHASKTLVKAGDIVLKDTPIAKVGSTGYSTGPHLHFEVRQNHKTVNPLPLISQPSLNVAKAL